MKNRINQLVKKQYESIKERVELHEKDYKQRDCVHGDSLELYGQLDNLYTMSLYLNATVELEEGQQDTLGTILDLRDRIAVIASKASEIVSRCQ